MTKSDTKQNQELLQELYCKAKSNCKWSVELFMGSVQLNVNRM